MKAMRLIDSDEKAWADAERESCHVESARLTHEPGAAGP